MALRLQVVTSVFPGAPAYNNFYWLNNLAGDSTIFVNAVMSVFDTLSGLLQNAVEVDFDGIVEVFDPATGQTTSTIPEDPWNVPGTWGSGHAPGGTCLLLQWRTGTFDNGREVRGRSFISGLGDIGEGSAGVPSGPLSTATAAATTYAAIDGAAVYSPTNGGVLQMSVGSAWNKFGLMRSRRD